MTFQRDSDPSLSWDELTPHILVINADTVVCEQLRRLYTQCAYIVSVMRRAETALQTLAEGSTDLVVTDVCLPDVDGVKFVEQIRESYSDVPVIVITGDRDVESAVKVLKLGVSDFIGTPFNAEAVQQSTRVALEKAQIFTELRHMRRTIKEDSEFLGMLSKTPEMHRVFETIRMVSNIDVTVLVEGETGTGKELVARAIHERSPRRRGQLVTINCAALPDPLLESELFGYEKGAFTGADHARPGMIEMAHKGTLFLDEIESMSLSMQAKLLRVLQDKKVQRLGGNRTYEVDMRVIAASNVAAKDLVREGRMRSDFYYRINVVLIRVIPLRQRRGDIPLLVQNFLQQHPFAVQRRITGISSKAMSQLMGYSWPGNVRELQNVLEKAVVLASLPVIESVEVPDESSQFPETQTKVPTEVPITRWIKEQEKKYLVQQLQAFNGSLDQAAVNSGICVRTLFRKMRLYGLDKKQFRPQPHEVSSPPEVRSVIKNNGSATKKKRFNL